MKITNTNLILFLETYFNKKISDIESNDLATIEVLTLDSKNLLGEYEQINFEEILSLFPNLKELIVVNSLVSTNDINCINKHSIQSITFRSCAFDEPSSLTNLSNSKSLSIIKCFMDSFTFLGSISGNLSRLEICAPEGATEILLDAFSKKTLEALILEMVDLKNQDFSDCTNCRMISILNNDIDEKGLETLASLQSLEELYIEPEYASKLTEAMPNTAIKTNWNELFVDAGPRK